MLFEQNIQLSEVIFEDQILEEIEGKNEEIIVNQDEHAYALTFKTPVLESNYKNGLKTSRFLAAV